MAPPAAMTKQLLGTLTAMRNQDPPRRGPGTHLLTQVHTFLEVLSDLRLALGRVTYAAGKPVQLASGCSMHNVRYPCIRTVLQGRSASPGSPYLLLSGPMASESSSSDDAPLDCLSAASSLAFSASAVALLASVWAPSSLFLSSLFAFSDSSRRSSVRRTWQHRHIVVTAAILQLRASQGCNISASPYQVKDSVAGSGVPAEIANVYVALWWGL